MYIYEGERERETLNCLKGQLFVGHNENFSSACGKKEECIGGETDKEEDNQPATSRLRVSVYKSFDIYPWWWLIRVF